VFVFQTQDTCFLNSCVQPLYLDFLVLLDYGSYLGDGREIVISDVTRDHGLDHTKQPAHPSSACQPMGTNETTAERKSSDIGGADNSWIPLSPFGLYTIRQTKWNVQLHNPKYATAK
jgi:hypothetical protein